MSGPRTRYRIAIAVAAMMAVGCGPSVRHDGYRKNHREPWSDATEIALDDHGEAEIDGVVSYPKRRRAAWYAIDLPGTGDLEVKMIADPIRAGDREFDLAFEILDSSYRVIERADRDEDDAGDLRKQRVAKGLGVDRYYVHVFAQERNDQADFTLRLAYRGGEGTTASNFPAELAFIGVLPAVPLNDDTPIRAPTKKPTKRSRKPTPEKKERSIRGRIAGLSSSGKGTLIKIDRGSSHGIQKGWRGVVTNRNGTAIQNGSFVIDRVTSSESYAVVRTTQDAVTAAKYVRLRPP